jgi:hypothetical protein
MDLQLAESPVQPSTKSTEEAVATTTALSGSPAKEMQQAVPAPPIIWTPRFIVIFALALVVGLTAEGLFAEGWANRLYPGGWILLIHAILALGWWTFILARARSWWIRTGAIFACIWGLFACLNALMEMHGVDSSLAIIAHLNAATCSALLGAYICLSLDRTPLHRWDAWFFSLALVLGSSAVALFYFLTPVDSRSLAVLEGDLSATALFLCVCVWWLRPSCWKARPGPTFLFGIAPAILLFLAIPKVVDGATNLFLSQVVFLCITLGIMRLVQCELVN